MNTHVAACSSCDAHPQEFHCDVFTDLAARLRSVPQVGRRKVLNALMVYFDCESQTRADSDNKRQPAKHPKKPYPEDR